MVRLSSHRLRHRGVLRVIIKQELRDVWVIKVLLRPEY